MIANTPAPPYYAVIFTSTLSNDTDGYEDVSQEMIKLAEQQAGFLGFESAREEIGISVSYWSDLESIEQWKANTRHQVVQKLGKTRWYESFITRVSLVERDSGIHTIS